MKVPLSAKIPKETKDRLEILAGKERRSLSQMVVILIEEAMIQRIIKEGRNGDN